MVTESHNCGKKILHDFIIADVEIKIEFDAGIWSTIHSDSISGDNWYLSSSNTFLQFSPIVLLLLCG